MNLIHFISSFLNPTVSAGGAQSAQQEKNNAREEELLSNQSSNFDSKQGGEWLVALANSHSPQCVCGGGKKAFDFLQTPHNTHHANTQMLYRKGGSRYIETTLTKGGKANLF